MTKTTTVFWTTRAPAELDERLERAAELEDRQKAAIVRRAVERYLDDLEHITRTVARNTGRTKGPDVSRSGGRD